MHRSSLSSYLRTERKRSGLTQKEFGELLGVGEDAVRKAENGRRPTVHLALAAEVVFDLSTRDLFPGLHEALEYDILLRAVAMEFRLSERDDPVSRRKCGHLSALINRIQFHQSL